MQSISSFYLDNEGGFVCATGCNYIDPNGGSTSGGGGGNISLGQNEYYNPGDHGVPAGSFVQLRISIKGGSDRTGGSYYMYDPTVSVSARYKITGTTLNSNVICEGVS
jgi:hypothetical protein